VQVWCRIADVNFQGKIGIFKECSFWQQMQHVILRKKTVFPSNSNQVSQLLYISIAEIQRFRDRFFFTRGIARLIDLMKNHPAVSQELKDEVTELLNHETLQSSPKGDSS